MSKIEKGKKYIVIADTLGHFKKGTEVIALENSSCPYCVIASAYDENKCVFGYELGLVGALADSDLKEAGD